MKSGPKTQRRPGELGCPGPKHHRDGPEASHRHPEHSGRVDATGGREDGHVDQRSPKSSHLQGEKASLLSPLPPPLLLVA